MYQCCNTYTVAYPPTTQSPCKGDHDVLHSQRPSSSLHIQPHYNHTTLGHGLHYLLPFARTQCYQLSIFPETIPLPHSVVSCTASVSFKRRVLPLTLQKTARRCLPALYIVPFNSLLYKYRHFKIYRAAPV